jgi:glutathione S-transferase
MILIGQYDSPFVRRVAIAMSLYDIEFEHRPWSTFREGDKIAPYNPLRRVPTLVLDDGTVIIESAYMLDYLDEQVGEGALIAKSGAARQQTLYIVALSTGLADKAVSLTYEQILHEVASETWQDRCVLQIKEVLTRLEAIRKAAQTPYIMGDKIGHADIALACALRFVADAHPDSIALQSWPALLAHSQMCEALPLFMTHSQAFTPPKRT